MASRHASQSVVALQSTTTSRPLQSAERQGSSRASMALRIVGVAGASEVVVTGDSPRVEAAPVADDAGEVAEGVIDGGDAVGAAALQAASATRSNPILAAAVLSAAAGMPIEKYAEEKLFKPLAMKNYAWDRADGKGLVSAGWGLRLRPVDMAKVGLLVMHDGRWQGQQIVPAAWIRQMVSPGVVPYFGNYWWINDIVEGEPEYDAMGFKGQFIVVLPKRDAVVVMTSLLPIEGGLRDAENVKIMRRIMKDYVIPALDGGTGGGTGAPVSASIRNTLDNELKLSAASMPTPGTEADPTDTPRH